jgi:2-iminobutanoate/2-iminopropanoate deaminase
MSVHPILPSPAGPFAEACVVGNLVFTSGMAGCDMATGAVAGVDAASQTRKALENLRSVLRAAGTDFAHVVKVDIMARHRKDADAINRVYAEFFRDHHPARCWKFTSDMIAPDFLLEIEMVAEIP